MLGAFPNRPRDGALSLPALLSETTRLRHAQTDIVYTTFERSTRVSPKLLAKSPFYFLSNLALPAWGSLTLGETLTA